MGGPRGRKQKITTSCFCREGRESRSKGKADKFDSFSLSPAPPRTGRPRPPFHFTHLGDDRAHGGAGSEGGGHGGSVFFWGGEEGWGEEAFLFRVVNRVEKLDPERRKSWSRLRPRQRTATRVFSSDPALSILFFLLSCCLLSLSL